MIRVRERISFIGLGGIEFTLLTAFPITGITEMTDFFDVSINFPIAGFLFLPKFFICVLTASPLAYTSNT